MNDDGSSTPFLDLDLDLLSFLNKPTTGPRQAREREPDRACPPARHLVPRRGHELGARVPEAAGFAVPRRGGLGEAREGKWRRRRRKRKRSRRERRFVPVSEWATRRRGRRVSRCSPSPPSRLARHPSESPRGLLPARQAQQHFGLESQHGRRRLHPLVQPEEDRPDGRRAGEVSFFLFYLLVYRLVLRFFFDLLVVFLVSGAFYRLKTNRKKNGKKTSRSASTTTPRRRFASRRT